MIRVRNLVKDFGERRAVDDVSFTVDKGTVLGFLGPNGAGKTTSMRMITGFLPPTSGTAEIEGFDILESPIEARQHVGYLPENAPLYGDMTVTEFLGFVAELRGFRGKENAVKVDEIIETCFLREVEHQTIDTLSKGYRQRTCFAQALIHDPPALILDEPTDGLDPNQKKVVRDMIRHMAKTKSIILSTHILEEVEAVCNRVIIISRGRVVTDSRPEALKARSRLHQACTVSLKGPAEDVRAALGGLEPVGRVEDLPAAEPDGAPAFRVFPANGRPVTEAVLAEARARDWAVERIETHEGRLDDVFMQMTSTEDVTAEAEPEGEGE